MQVVLYFFALYKCYNFLKWKVVQPPPRSLDSPYTEHGSPHFHIEHHLNWLTHEYINTWLSLATLSVGIEVVASPWSVLEMAVHYYDSGLVHG